MVAGETEYLAPIISTKDMDRYIEAMNIPEPLDYKEAIKIARDKENASRMLYTILSARSSSPN